MLYIIPPLIGIILLGFVCKRALKVETAFTFFIAIAGIILWLLIGGSVNLLYVFRIALYCGIYICGIYQVAKNKQLFLAYIKNPATIMFLVSVLGLSIVYMFHNSFYFGWDDFSHWGPFYKSIFMENSLLQFSNIPMVHQSYPQGMTVLFYYTALFSSSFIEAQTFISVYIMLAACSTALLAFVEWKKPLQTVLTLCLLPLFYVLFPYSEPYISVCLDTTLGAVFGTVLLMIIAIAREDKRESHLGIWLGLALLVQIKPISILLALVCVVIYGVQIWLIQPAQSLAVTIRRNTNKQTFQQFGFGVASVVLSYGYWQVFLRITNTNKDQFSAPLERNFLERLQDSIAGKDEVFANIWSRFLINLRHMPVVYNGYGNALVVTVLLIVAGVVLGTLLIRLKKLWGPAISLWLMPLFFIAYLFSIFYTYITMMSEFEGLTNASFQRYISTFMIAWAMLLLGICLYYGENLLFKKLPNLLPTMAVLSILLLQANTIVQHDVLNLELSHEEAGRTGFGTVSDQMLAKLEPEDTIWLIAQNDDGMYRYMYHYTLFPANVSLATPETLSATLSKQEVLAIAQENNIDYIVVYIIDDAFDQAFAPLFSDKLASVKEKYLPSLYRVELDEKIPFQLVVATQWGG